MCLYGGGGHIWFTYGIFLTYNWTQNCNQSTLSNLSASVWKSYAENRILCLNRANV